MEKSSKNMPSKEEAINILKEAEIRNSGQWVNHSYYVAEAAELIARNIDELDPDIAYVLGLLHDIGRREGIYGMRHSIDGYNFALKKGYDLVARVCLTHIGFKLNDRSVIVGKWDGTPEERAFIIEYLNRIEETDYDRLIKLCDYLSLPRWRSSFENMNYFETKLGKSIYQLLPNVVENTFKI